MGAPRKLSHFRLAEEDVAPSDHANWPTAQSSGFTSVPFTEVSLETTNEETGRERYTNSIDREYGGIVAQDAAGGLTTEIWPDNAELLFDFGLKRSSNIMESYTLEAYDAGFNEYVQYRGLMCNTCTIAASEDDKELTLAYDCMAQGEYTTSPFNIGSLPNAQSFLFSDATFTLWGTTELHVTGFTITVNNNLTLGPHIGSSRLVRWIDTSVRNVEVNISVQAEANTYRAYLRNRAVSGIFVATFNYPGTGSPNDVITLTCPEMNLREAPHEGGVNDIASTALVGTALKTASQAAIVYALS